MDILIVSAAAAVAALLTLFSGFGLGTLLMPVFALFVPLPLAVAATAVVHLANNLFKSALLIRHADPVVLLRFGIPAVLAAFAGAALLTQFAGEPRVLLEYRIAGHPASVTLFGLLFGLLIVAFAVFELLPASARLALPPRWLPLGGLASGFLGGLSGHQGALRAIFLRRTGLDPTRFAATSAAIAIGVDLARLIVYGSGFGALLGPGSAVSPALLGSACLAAFAGSALARRLLPKVTIRQLDWLTAGLLLTIGTLLLLGLI